MLPHANPCGQDIDIPGALSPGRGITALVRAEIGNLAAGSSGGPSARASRALRQHPRCGDGIQHHKIKTFSGTTERRRPAPSVHALAGKDGERLEQAEGDLRELRKGEFVGRIGGSVVVPVAVESRVGDHHGGIAAGARTIDGRSMKLRE